MDAIEYTLRFPAPASHYVEVEAVYPTGGAAAVELMMAVWTPGSYMVRDYAGRLERVRCVDVAGEEAPALKTRKNRWRVETGGADIVTLRYSIYCREMTVRSNWVESGFALLNGAPTFVTLVDSETDRPAAMRHAVRLEPPAGWRVHTTLEPGEGAFVAEDFDELVDSPIVAGHLAVDEFDVGGAAHALVSVGDWTLFDRERAAADVAKLVAEQHRFWGDVPYKRYSFLNALTEGRGGLEHKHSMLIMGSRWASRTRKGYVAWLKLVSHEFFHTWNVKRLRPEALGPFDYEREVHTRSLWVAEGLTSYYEAVLQRRAGLMTDDEFLGALSEDIEVVEKSPGRLNDPVAEASFDAWIKLYKRDENSVNATISYYTKGAVIAFLLDAEVRRRSAGERTLDDALRAAWKLHSGEKGFREAEFRAILSETAGDDLADWLSDLIDRAGPIEYERALEWFGLRFRAAEPLAEARGWMGVETEAREGRLMVTVVRRGTPAHDAGVQFDDEIVAMDDYRVGPLELVDRLGCYRPDDEAVLTVTRRGRLERLAIRFGATPEQTWRLEIDPDAEDAAVARRVAWMAG